MLAMCPSFAFGTDGTRGPCVLTSSLGPMAHTVHVSKLRLLDQWHTKSVCPSFAFGTNSARSSVCPSFAFGTDVARGSVSFGPN